jgi:hypothetical protein
MARRLQIKLIYCGLVSTFTYRALLEALVVLLYRPFTHTHARESAVIEYVLHRYSSGSGPRRA